MRRAFANVFAPHDNNRLDEIGKAFAKIFVNFLKFCVWFVVLNVVEDHFYIF